MGKTIDDLARSKDRNDQVHWLYLIGNRIRDGGGNGSPEDLVSQWLDNPEFDNPEFRIPAWFSELDREFLIWLVGWNPGDGIFDMSRKE
jgi:hypothetical protein